MRHQFAAELALRGLTADDVQLLADDVLGKAGVRRLGLGELVNLLRDEERTQFALEDLRKVALKSQGPPGNSIRREDVTRVRQFEREWEDYQSRKAKGLTDETPMPMPWRKPGPSGEE
jgi:hypothetical protein